MYKPILATFQAQRKSGFYVYFHFSPSYYFMKFK